MHIENLVKMTNNISAFFQAEPDRSAAVHGVADHIRKNWEPRMRQQIISHLKAGGEGLSDLSREAIAQIAGEVTKSAA